MNDPFHRPPVIRRWLACTLLLWVQACGGGHAEVEPLDLGGGLVMTADGVMIEVGIAGAGERGVIAGVDPGSRR